MPYGRRGGEFVVNTKLVGVQFTPSIAGFDSGGFIVVWQTTDALQDGAGRAIKAQRYDSLGNAVGSEMLINSSAAGDQRAPSVTTLASGGYVVTWETTDLTQDGSGFAIKGQLFDSSGAAVGAEFLVNSQAATNQIKSSVTGLEGGGFVVTWQTADPAQDGHSSAIKGQIYSAAGVAVGGEFLVNTGAVGGESSPDVTSLAGGGFVATWTLGSGQFADVYAQVFDSAGAKSGGQFIVSSTSALNQDFASVSEISGGRFVVTWQSSASLNTGDVEIRARIFSADGTPIGNDFLVNTARTDPGTGVLIGSSQPKVEELPDGGFVITWTHSAGNYIWSSIRGQFFDSSGNRVGTEVVVSTVTNRLEGLSDVAVDGNGMLFAVWSSANQSAQDDDIRGQLFSSNGAPEIVSNGGGSTASVTVAENQNAVTIVTATDPDGTSGLVYSIVGGADASRFAINASTGALTFVSAPNFEARLDFGGNNIYDVVVSVSDGSLTDTQALAISVSNVNEGVTISGSQTDYFHIENRNAVATFSASDVDGDPITWSIAGGADAALFAIDSATGALRFVAAPDFEAPADAGADNFYNVTIAASDGSLSATRALTIEIANWNEGPVIVSGGGGDTASVSVAENTGLVTTIVADDPDHYNSPFSYSIVGGADAHLFIVHAQTGQLFFYPSGRDYEAPTDADGDNVYEVVVAASDGWEPADTQAISVTVTDANDAPVITSNGGGFLASVSMSENQLAVTTVTAADVEGGPLTYSIAGGADAALFAIDSQSGLLSFITAPDREAPGDSGSNNVYNVTVSVSDGDKTDTQQLSITILDVNEAPVITSNGGGGAAAISLAENGLAAANVAAADPEGQGLSYAISGGADASRFQIDASTGALSFVTAPDHEQPGDSDGDNVYDVTVVASDGLLSDSQHLSITIGNVNEGVTITSGTDFSIEENGTAVTIATADDLDGDSVSFAIAGGADAALFAIDSATGALSFASAPDFEAPADSDGDNVYQVEVSASDGSLSDTRSISVTVTNANEAIAFVSGGGGDQAAVTVDENMGNVLGLLAVDPDGGTPHYGIAGGADSALFELDPVTKALRFKALPDFEMPLDADGDNVYEVIVGTTDGQSFDYQTVSVTVANVYEGVSFAAPESGFLVDENMSQIGILTADGEAGASIIYAVTGGADAAHFTIDPLTGALSFHAAPDFEGPADSGGDNVYHLVVTANDGIASASQAVSVAVGNVNEGVTITSGTAASIAENGTEAMVVSAADLDGDAVSFAITGGSDSALFAIDAQSGALSFVGAPDYEAPADSDGDNVYEVEVSASDGALSDSRSISVTVTNSNEAIAFVSGGGGDQAAVTVDENMGNVLGLHAVDPDGTAPHYGIAGGADAALFELDPVTKGLRFKGLPDFETPLDADGDNVYEVIVGTTDGVHFDYQTVSVTVANVYEGVVFDPAGAFAVDEGGVQAGAVSARGEAGASIVYAIAGGADSALFTIDPATGALAFASAPDFESPEDLGGDNVYDLIVSASDGISTDIRSVSVAVGNVDEPVEILSYGGAAAVALTVEENSLSVGAVAARDEEDWPVTFSITGGADAARFQVDPYSGALSFLYPNLPDFEAPGDSGGDNVYDVVVTASSSTSTADQAFAISVADRNEGLWIISNGGGDAVVSMNEGESAVTIVIATDLDGDVPVYSIVGGADAARFAIDAATGALSFIAAPDYEAPQSGGGVNSYWVEVGAGDGEFTYIQKIRIDIANVNEGVAITSGGGAATLAVTVAENGTAVTTVAASDVDGDSPTYAIAGGADASRFAIDASTGALSFVQAPNFEAPADSGGDNVYDVIVSASDGVFTDSQAIAVSVGNVDEGIAIISNGGGAAAAVAAAENGTAVAVVAAIDIDGGPVTYAIAGGADSSRFAIDASTGALSFVQAPNFEAPADSGGDNVYDVIVSASDGTFIDTQTLAVSVGNVNEAPLLTSGATFSVAENGLAVAFVAAADPDGTPVTYSIVGGADSARFTIDASTGALRFVAAPDWELPADFGGNNVYDLVVRAGDGQLFDDRALSVTVTNVRDGNTVTGTGGKDTISATSSSLSLRTSSEEDVVFARDGHDTIHGMGGDDELHGEGGNDLLVGGEGADILSGGSGKDQFVYNQVSESTAGSSDLILDFSRSQGDKISLSEIDANSLTSSNQAFTFIGASAFSNVPGQLRYETAGGMTIISGDVDGDGIADLQIQLSGHIPLIASDFIL